MPKLTTAITTALVLALLSVPTTAWSQPTSDTPMQEAITDVIEEYGGTQTAWNEVSWDDGETTLVLDPGLASPQTGLGRGATSTSACTKGRYCAYGKTDYLGSRLEYSACPATVTSFGPVSSVRSIKNNRSSGTIKAYKGSTLKTTLSPGNNNKDTTGTTKITCS